jgi:hypothetical protein
MKKLIPFLILLMAGAVRGQEVPLYNARLTSNLNGGLQAITNVSDVVTTGGVSLAASLPEAPSNKISYVRSNAAWLSLEDVFENLVVATNLYSYPRLVFPQTIYIDQGGGGPDGMVTRNMRIGYDGLTWDQTAFDWDGEVFPTTPIFGITSGMVLRVTSNGLYQASGTNTPEKLATEAFVQTAATGTIHSIQYTTNSAGVITYNGGVLYSGTNPPAGGGGGSGSGFPLTNNVSFAAFGATNIGYIGIATSAAPVEGAATECMESVSGSRKYFILGGVTSYMRLD